MGCRKGGQSEVDIIEMEVMLIRDAIKIIAHETGVSLAISQAIIAACRDDRTCHLVYLLWQRFPQEVRVGGGGGLIDILSSIVLTER